MFRAFLDIIFPPLCHICREFVPGAGELHLCARCRGEIEPVSSPHCPVCGAPFATINGSDHTCGSCLTSTPPFTAARAATLFEGPVRELVHRFKYQGKVHLRRPLGLLTVNGLGEFIEAACPDGIVPVPLHRKRLRERGFNQALLLGEVLARQWRIPLHRDVLRRIRWTEPQVNLAAAERSANVKGAFSVQVPTLVEGRRLLLLDDVYTTGSTVMECAKTLKKAGASEVFVVTVARARH